MHLILLSHLYIPHFLGFQFAAHSQYFKAPIETHSKYAIIHDWVFFNIIFLPHIANGRFILLINPIHLTLMPACFLVKSLYKLQMSHFVHQNPVSAIGPHQLIETQEGFLTFLGSKRGNGWIRLN